MQGEDKTRGHGHAYSACSFPPAVTQGMPCFTAVLPITRASAGFSHSGAHALAAGKREGEEDELLKLISACAAAGAAGGAPRGAEGSGSGPLLLQPQAAAEGDAAQQAAAAEVELLLLAGRRQEAFRWGFGGCHGVVLGCLGASH